MAFLSSQGASWSLRVVLRNTAAGLPSPWLLLLVHFVWTSALSFISVVPVLFQFLYQPQEILLISRPLCWRVPGLRQPPRASLPARDWSGLEGQQPCGCSCLLPCRCASPECAGYLSGQAQGSVACFYFFHNMLMINRSCVSFVLLSTCACILELLGMPLSFLVNITHGFLICYLKYSVVFMWRFREIPKLCCPCTHHFPRIFKIIFKKMQIIPSFCTLCNFLLPSRPHPGILPTITALCSSPVIFPFLEHGIVHCVARVCLLLLGIMLL